jgi:AcrR family transcriptional regulator
LSPESIIDVAFSVAEETSIDDLSIPAIAKALDVGVNSIYWHVRNKNELLDQMTDVALRRSTLPQFVVSDDWTDSLADHARGVRRTFLNDRVLTDLILIRGALSPTARRLGVQEMEKAIATLVNAGLSLEEAFDTYSAVSVLVRGSVLINRLAEKTGAVSRLIFDDRPWGIDRDTAPLLATLQERGHMPALGEDQAFEHGLKSVLDDAARRIEAKAHISRRAAARRGRTSGT